MKTWSTHWNQTITNQNNKQPRVITTQIFQGQIAIILLKVSTMFKSVHERRLGRQEATIAKEHFPCHGETKVAMHLKHHFRRGCFSRQQPQQITRIGGSSHLNSQGGPNCVRMTLHGATTQRFIVHTWTIETSLGTIGLSFILITKQKKLCVLD